MLGQLLKILTPDLIIQAVKDNPKVVMETLQKFDTFKLLGQSLTPELQIVLSNNAGLVNHYLADEDGKAAARLWAEGFSEYVDGVKARAEAKIAATIKAEEDAKALEQAKIDEENKALADSKALEDAKIEARYLEENKIRIEADAKARAEAEAQIRKESEAQIRAETLARIRSEIEDEVRAELTSKLKTPLKKAA